MEKQLAIRQSKQQICAELKKLGITGNALEIEYLIGSASIDGEQYARDIIDAESKKKWMNC